MADSLKGLSILIPVYMYDVRTLIAGLIKEVSGLNESIEIIVYDDESSWQYLEGNREIEKYRQVHYVELLQNVGRSAIRNMMAQTARFDTLLFLDADSEIVVHGFIKKYLAAKELADIVVGGTIYSNCCPSISVRLRWLFGVKRESISEIERSKSPFSSLKTNNLIIKKSIFQKIGLDEEIEGYGHEDTLLGEQLESMGASILHIANPLKHTGLESNSVFLEKSMEAVRNLSRLIKSNKGGTKTSIYKAWKKSQWFLPQFFLRLIDLNQIRLKIHLESGKSSLFWYDLYRLYYFNQLMKNSSL
jgi:glycosyltransferase involved in cell wall biosynthesis